MNVVITVVFLFLMIMIGSTKERIKTNNDRLNDRIDDYTKSNR
jgi:uncharacterized membrane protein